MDNRDAPATKGDVTALKGDVKALKGDVAALKVNLDDFKVEVNARFEQFEHRIEALLQDISLPRFTGLRKAVSNA